VLEPAVPVTLRKVKPSGESSLGRDADGAPLRNSIYTPHDWPRPVPDEAFSAYEVLVKVRGKNVSIGVVCSARERSERKVGRLRVEGGVHRFWIAEAFWGEYRMVGYRSPQRIGYHHWDRGYAVYELVGAWVEAGKPRPERAVETAVAA
jgi:hypothetical protein